VALPNLIVKRPVMPELVGDITPSQVADETTKLLQDEGARQKLRDALTAIPDEAGAARAVVSAMPLGVAG
jgi:lipid A disaccharide synthetase